MKGILLTVIGLAMVAPASVLHAQTGNIDPSQRHAWAENAGWLDFRPVFGGVTVLPTYLTGYAWHESAGWVKLGVDAGGPYVNDGSPGTWGVNLNSVTGVLSGFAWSESAGWIRMNPAFGGVAYDDLTHQMSGWAWSESHGWIHFRSTGPTVYGVAVVVESVATGFYPVLPCRLFDTRFSEGPQAAAPILAAGETRTLTVGTRCGLSSSTIRSLSVNQTVTAPSANGELVLFGGDPGSVPITSNISYGAGKTRANNSILELSRNGDGTFSVHNRSTGSVHFILDVNGTFK